MRLFKRSTPPHDDTRCPECGERAPRGADECAMCGHELADVRPETSGVEARKTSSADAFAEPRNA